MRITTEMTDVRFSEIQPIRLIESEQSPLAGALDNSRRIH